MCNQYDNVYVYLDMLADKSVDKQNYIKILIYIYIMFEKQKILDSPFDISVGDIVDTCFPNKDKKYMSKIVKNAILDILNSKVIGNHNLYINYYCNCDLTKIRSNTVITIFDIECSLDNNFQMYIPITHTEFLDIVNIDNLVNPLENEYSIKSERILVTYIFVKYIFFKSGNYEALQQCNYKGVSLSSRIIEKHTGINKSSILEYLNILKEANLISSFWFGKYKPIDSKEKEYRTSPVVYSIGCGYNAYQSIYNSLNDLKERYNTSSFSREEILKEKLKSLERNV